MGYKLGIGDFEGSTWDTVTITYPSDTVEVYSFRDGGTSGTVLYTVTITYADSTKARISSVERA